MMMRMMMMRMMMMMKTCLALSKLQNEKGIEHEKKISKRIIIKAFQMKQHCSVTQLQL